VSKAILYIATSKDGFIADVDGGVDWLPHPDDPEDLVGYKALLERIGVIVMGRHSYEQILTFGEWAWKDKQTYVFTSNKLESKVPSVEFVNDDPKVFMEKLKATGLDKDVWLLGGAKLAQSFLTDDLIDEIVLTIIPINLGSGIHLALPLDNFTLRAEKPCMDGIIQRVYLRDKS